eukprot:SAG11_NODE_25174_length_362_cov_1.589354_1_plen_45_part_01
MIQCLGTKFSTGTSKYKTVNSGFWGPSQGGTCAHRPLWRLGRRSY